MAVLLCLVCLIILQQDTGQSIDISHLKGFLNNI